MKFRFVISCLTFILFFYALDGLAAEKVADIAVSGNQRIETESILNKISHRKGSKLSTLKLRDDIQSLYDMGYFNQIVVHKELLGGGAVRLIFVLEELPVIRDIEIVGNSNFGQEDMEKEMEIKIYEVASRQKIELSLHKIKEKYKEKGFHLAQLTYELVPVKREVGAVTLVVKVQENERIRVRKILFLGNKSFSDHELKQVMLSKEGNAMSWLTSGGKFHELMFDQDVQLIRFWYLDRGYAKVQVIEPQVLLSSDKRWADLHIKIIEGPKYNIGELNYAGDLLFTIDELAAESHLQSGQLFRSSFLQAEMARLTDLYGDLGYAFTNVIPETRLNDETLIINITFRFEKGNKISIRRITFVGNTKTHDKVLRREMRIYEGELYSSTRKKLSERFINRLGFFKKVLFRTKVVQDNPNLMDIEIEIEEQSTGTLTVGAGYSTQDGFIAQGRISQENFLGTGQLVQLSAQIAGSRTRFVLGYDEPYLLDYPIRFGVSMYFTDRNVYSNVGLSFSELKGGGNVRFGLPLTDNMEVSATYKLERIWLNDVFNPMVITDAANEGWLSSAILSFVADIRNNRIRPTSGFYGSTSAEYAGLGGNLNFIKFLGNVRWYVPLFLGIVYRSNLTVGALLPIGSNPLPVTERFVLGGIYDIRGYKPGSIGPMVCSEPTRTNSDGTFMFPSTGLNQFFCSPFGTGPNGLQRIPFNIGGRYQAFLNTEFEYTLIPSLGINLVVFVDVGTTVDKFKTGGVPTVDDPTNPFFPSPLLRASVGWGIRWWSPIGPLRFEFGYPLIRPLDEPAFDAQFAISPTF